MPNFVKHVFWSYLQYAFYCNILVRCRQFGDTAIRGQRGMSSKCSVQCRQEVRTWAAYGQVPITANENVRCLTTPDHQVITPKSSLMWLGPIFGEDGSIHSELNRHRLWGHASITRQGKMEVLQTTIASGLLYGVSAIWLYVCDQRRLDGFRARYLRWCLGIKHSYIFRVFNQTVNTLRCYFLVFVYTLLTFYIVGSLAHFLCMLLLFESFI